MGHSKRNYHSANTAYSGYRYKRHHHSRHRKTRRDTRIAHVELHTVLADCFQNITLKLTKLPLIFAKFMKNLSKL